MNKTVISVAALALVGAGVFAFAQTQTATEPDTISPIMSTLPGMSGMPGMRSSAEDRAVFLEARIGAIKAVLKLTPDQEKLWEPVEALIRKAAALRAQAEEVRAGPPEVGSGGPDPLAKMRRDADRMIRRASFMREFADAAAPLYASLSEDQRRRILVLIQRTRHDMRGWAGERGGRGNMMDPEMEWP
jgi:zinc resistance-associated protein